MIDLSSEFSVEMFQRDVHTVSHIETPAYLFRQEKSIDQFAVETFVADAVLLDLTNKEPGQPIDDEDLEGAEERAGLALREGEAVLLNTRASALTPSAGNHPYLSENGAQFLEFKHPSIVGTDAPSIDPIGSADLRAHSTLLRARILVLEGLWNLSEIEQPRFRLVALPIRSKGPASPVRAVAIVEP